MRTNSRPRRAARERGIAMLSIIALLLILIIFLGAVVVSMSQEINSVHNDGVSNRALVAADGGVRGMILALEESISTGGPVPTPIAYTYPEAAGAPTVSYTASIQDSWVPIPSATAVPYAKYYLISSTGQVNDGNTLHQRTVNVIVLALSSGFFESASNYSTNQFGKVVWYTPDQTFNGPVYDGGPMHVEYNGVPSATPVPIFLSTVSTASGSVFWRDLYDGSTATPGTGGDSADWPNIISSGSSTGFNIGVNPIGLPQPQTNDVVASEAYWGNPSSTPGPCAAVCMNSGPAESGTGRLNTGIYVCGSAGGCPGAATIDAASTGSSDTGVETFTITGAFKGTYTIQVNFGADTTTVTKRVGKSTTTATYQGVPSGVSGTTTANGAIYVDGSADIGANSVFQGDYLIAVPDESGNARNITLLGAITYNDQTKDELGLWANDVIINTTASNITVDASIIAGYPGEAATDGGFYNALCNKNTCDNNTSQGTLTLFGALMENMRGAVGKFISPGVHYGFDRQVSYDSRLGANPPPFYPVTGNYTIVSWDDEGT